MKPAKHTMTVLNQVVDLIPAYLVPKLARKHGVDKKSRSFTPWSHVVSLVHTQLAHSLSLNDVCDDLRNHIRAGEVVVFDKAYIDFVYLYSLERRDVFWVTRAKDNMAYEIVGQQTTPSGPILLDATIRLTVDKSRCDYPEMMRLIVAVVDVDGKETVMSFITNNFDWAPSSICDLYKARWGGEVFFKQIKQTLQLADFLGHNEQAIRWQVWTALLTYLLLRFIAFRSQWARSFARLFTVLRSVLWDRLDMYSVLKFCGTAPGAPPLRTAPGQAYLPGLAP